MKIMIPSDKSLYSIVKKEADKKFLASTSIYKSAWIVRTYKGRGGKFDDKPDPAKGLKRWFKEKWIDLNRVTETNKAPPCGRSVATTKGTYPLCRPSVRVSDKTPKLSSELGVQSIQKAKYEKQKVKHKKHVRFD